MRRTTLLGILILAATGVGLCARAGGGRPVVGFAYTRLSAGYVALAESAFAARGLSAPLILWDSTAEEESTEGAAALAATFVARPEVAVVVGPSNSRHALVTAPAYNAAGLAQIVPSATSRRLRGAGPATFTLAPDDSVEGEFLARFAAATLGARRALIFYVNDEYGEGLRAGIVRSFVAQGGEIVDAYPVGAGVDVGTLVRAAYRRGRPDVILMAGRGQETGLLLRTTRALDPAVPVVAGDGAYYPAQLREHAGSDLSGLYVVAFWVYDSTDAAHRAFADRARRALGRDPMPEDALTEDALMLAAAARSAAGPDRAAVRRWLGQLGRDHPPFPGLTGPIEFGPERRLPLAMVRFHEERVERVDLTLVPSDAAP